VHKNNVTRFLQLDQDLFEVDTKKDLNRCLVKINNGAGDWGFALRFIDDLPVDHRDPVLLASWSPDGHRIGQPSELEKTLKETRRIVIL